MSIRDALKLIAQTVGIVMLLLIAMLVIAPVIHEAGHTLLALIRGVSFKDLEFGFQGLGPSVTIPSYVSQETLVYFRYAGGLFAGALLIICYVLYSIWQRHAYAQSRWWSRFRWWLGYIILAPSGYNLLYAYLEGAHFVDYVTGKLPTTTQLLIAIIAPFVIHLFITLILVKTRSSTID